MATIAIDQDERERSLGLPALIGVAMLGAGIGVGVASIGGWGPRRFSDSGSFDLWLFLIALQSALWAVGVTVFAVQLKQLSNGHWPAARRRVTVDVVAAAVPLLGFGAVVANHSGLHYPFTWHREKMTAFTVIGAAVALFGFAEFALAKFALDEEPANGTLADTGRFLEIRRLLEKVLSIEGAILAALILATAALRGAVNGYWRYLASHPAYLLSHPLQKRFLTTSQVPPFPREYVLIYGAFFTFLLALIYSPVYVRVLTAGRANVDAACKPVEPSSPNWVEVQEKRDKLAAHLQLSASASPTLRTAGAILAPLAGAFVGLLFGR